MTESLHTEYALEHGLVAIEEFGEVIILDLEPRDDLRAPFSEQCEGCDGLGHIGPRPGSPQGPCESCLGHGRRLYAFAVDDPFRTALVPPAIANEMMPR